jgi:hypothetical protein
MPRPRSLLVAGAVAALLGAAALVLGRGDTTRPAVAGAAVDGPRRAGARATSLARVPVLPQPRTIVCPLAPGSTLFLAASARRGLASHLRQYPSPALATAVQRRAAAHLLARLRADARQWRDPEVAALAGFSTRTARRAPGDRAVHWLHAEHRLNSADRRFLDPRRPESLIYANAPGRPLVLVGLMFSMRRGYPGPTPGGPLTRWHAHLVCIRGEKRGLKPLADGSCPAGTRRRQGSEMMHVWFTGDLRSAFAIHAPGPELCAAGLLPAATCRDPAAFRVM